MTTSDGTPRSLLRVLGLFEAIAGCRDGMSLVDLSQALGSPKSSLLLLLRPLVARGHLTHIDGRYRLGAAAFRLATTILAAREQSDQLRNVMEWLARESGETVHLTTIERERGLVTYIEIIPSEQPVRYVPQLGSMRPLYCSAAGRVLLAFQDEAWRESYLKRTQLKRLTPHTTTSVVALRRILDEVRREGVCVTIEETILGAAGCAAPIFNADGSVSSALLVGAPADRFRRYAERHKALVREAAARVSAAPPAASIRADNRSERSTSASRGGRRRVPSSPPP
ncbi:IclR family transcriptional regulator [Rubritepida flocculans]|uniref:IclR family transcriptional regulator n=1 Tax=Rubritepida flocculans TaxID=182403 RepID=UPI000410ADB3|nr:IclR family transcriptional regulator [Rubritepida flocculans]